jgi:hypothetical protein
MDAHPDPAILEARKLLWTLEHMSPAAQRRWKSHFDLQLRERGVNEYGRRGAWSSFWTAIERVASSPPGEGGG